LTIVIWSHFHYLSHQFFVRFICATCSLSSIFLNLLFCEWQFSFWHGVFSINCQNEVRLTGLHSIDSWSMLFVFFPLWITKFNSCFYYAIKKTFVLDWQTNDFRQNQTLLFYSQILNQHQKHFIFTMNFHLVVVFLFVRQIQS